MSPIPLPIPIPIHIPITILIAEDNPEILADLVALLAADPAFNVVGQAANGRLAVDLVVRLRPEVVIMDISMPLLNGLAATSLILKSAPATRVLMLSSHDDAAYVDQARALGAAGYLVKHTDAARLPAAIRSAHAGEPFIGPSNHPTTP